MHSISTSHFDMHSLYFLLRYYIFFMLFFMVWVSHIHSFWLLPGDDLFRFLDWILSILAVSDGPDKIRPESAADLAIPGRILCSQSIVCPHWPLLTSSLPMSPITDDLLASNFLAACLFVYLMGLVVFLHDFGLPYYPLIKYGTFDSWDSLMYGINVSKQLSLVFRATCSSKRSNNTGREATWRWGFVNYFLRVLQLYCSCPAAQKNAYKTSSLSSRPS